MSTFVPSRPRLSFWQMWNMSFGFLGIQFGFALQNANTSAIFETLGANPRSLAIFWVAAPTTGLLVQPLIGYYSDRTWHSRWGRRRPYFAIGAILASIAIFLMPNSGSLWMAVGVLWIMDASINISMEPFRALVGDMLPPSQRTTGFALQSLFIGTGAIVASALPWMFTHWFGVIDDPAHTGITDSIRYSFYIGAGMLLTTVLYTVFTTKEYPPTNEDAQHLRNRERRKIDDEQHSEKKLKTFGFVLSGLGILIGSVVFAGNVEKELYILSFGLLAFGLAFLIASMYISQGRSYLGFVHIAKDLISMPKTMVQLAYVQFFSWFALFSMWIYATPAVTAHIYHAESAKSAAYKEGAEMVGLLFGGYNGIAALAALFLPIIAKYTSRRVTHWIALTCGGAGLISIYFVANPNMLWLSMTGVGIAWASILSVPYAMLSGSLPSEKMGYYMGVFNFFIVIPQIIAGTLLGFLLHYVYNDQTIYVLVTGGFSLIVAGLLCLRVQDNDEVVIARA